MLPLILLSLLKKNDVVQNFYDTVQCDDGDIQLLMGEIRGPLVVCVSKRWATVCSDRWDDVDATVACRQLRYDSCKRYRITCIYCKHNNEVLKLFTMSM